MNDDVKNPIDFYEPVVRIIDDEETVRNSEAFTLRVVGIQTAAYESAEDFLSHDDLRHPGCVVLDVRMDGMSGLELQEEMLRRDIDLPILFLSGHGDISMAVMTIKKGAEDFLEKPVEPQKLRDTARRLIERNIEERREKFRVDMMKKRFKGLTRREVLILRLVAQNKLNKEIAAELGIQEHTVKVHRSNACRKLEIRSALEAHQFLKAIGELGD